MPDQVQLKANLLHQQLTQSDDSKMFQYDEEMDILMQNLDSQKL